MAGQMATHRDKADEFESRVPGSSRHPPGFSRNRHRHDELVVERIDFVQYIDRVNAAAIDLGTNSIKILIVKREKDGHMRVLFRHRSVVRLGEGTFTKKTGGKIPRHVQLRTLKALQTYAQFLEAYKVDVVRATGTSALRDAKNGPEFIR